MVYGNLLFNKCNQEDGLYLECINYISETESIIDSLNINKIIKEDSNDTGLRTYNIVNGSDDNYKEKVEKVKKGLLARIKEAFLKFIKFIQRAFTTLIDNIGKLYNKVNLQDSVAKKLFSSIEYESLTKAKENGWQGLKEGTPLIINIPELFNFPRYQDLKNDKDKDRFLKVLNNESSTYEDISEIESDINKWYKHTTICATPHLINRILDDVDFNVQFNAKNLKFRMDNPTIYSSEKIEKFMDDYKWCGLMIGTQKSATGYFIPEKTYFMNTKKMAIDGEKYTKDTRSSMKRLIDRCKTETVDILNEKYKNKAKNSSSSDNKNVELLVLKYKSMIANATLKEYIACTKDMITMIGAMNNISFNTFFLILQGCKKYKAI